MKKSIFFVLFLLFFCGFASAQRADRMTAMIDSQNITFNQAAYFASSYLGLGNEEMSNAEAGRLLSSFSSFPKLKNTEEPLTFQEFAYFCAKVWKIKGGISYSISKAPRYALRELKMLGFISPTTDPDTHITGREALFVMGKCAEYAEKQNTEEASK